MATVCHVTSSLGLRQFQVSRFLLQRGYMWQMVIFSVGVCQLQSVDVVCRRQHNGELHDLYCSTLLCIGFNEGRWDGNEHLESVEYGERETGFWWWYSRERGNLEYTGIDGTMILKLFFKTQSEMGTLNKLVCLSIETIGVLLWARKWTSGFHNVLRILLAEELSSS